jgi:hypothetical protein
MARRNLNTAPEPGKRYKTEKEQIRGRKKPPKTITLKDRVTYNPTNDE